MGPGFDDSGKAGERLVAIAISDTGAGMSDDVRERAFEPFFTTKHVGRGTGLGLSMVYGFVKQSRGAISIDSELGVGTTITMCIPSPVEPMPRVDEDSPGSRTVPQGTRVLLVEDDAEVRSIVRTFLDAMGCEVQPAATGEEALLWLTPDARFDLLLTDVALGAGMRGTQLAAEAQRRFPPLRILLMSGFSAELVDTGKNSPATWDLLHKPCTREELAQAVGTSLNSRAIVH
jgi:CheY-like chemotaxis protein